MAAAVIQGGSGVHLFNSSVYKYICGSDVADIRPFLDEIPDFEVKELLDQVAIYVLLLCITAVTCL